MKMKSIFVLLLTLPVFLTVDAALTWKNCEGTAPVQILQFSVSPKSLQLKPGKKFQFSAKFSVSGDAGYQYKLDLDIQRKAWGLWVPIPCIGDIGSCTHKGPKLTCDKMKTLIGENTCPLSHKEHTIPLREVTVPDIIVPPVVTSGRYWVRGDLKDVSDDRRIACVEAYLDLVA